MTTVNENPKQATENNADSPIASAVVHGSGTPTPNRALFHVEEPLVMVLGQGNTDGDASASTPIQPTPMDVGWTPEALEMVNGWSRRYEAIRQSQDLHEGVIPANKDPKASGRF